MRKAIVFFLVAGLMFVSGCKGKKETTETIRKPEISDKQIKEGFVTVAEGIQLRFIKIGKGRDVVVVPGAVYLEFEFRKLADKSRTLVLYDMRGRGKSSSITDPAKLGMDIEIDDLEKLRKHIRAKKISLIGWSYLGGMVALYAGRYPDHVNRVVQVGPISPSMEIYMKSSAAAAGGEYLTQLKALQEGDLKTTDPKKYCMMYWHLYMKQIFFDPLKISGFQQNICDCENEMPDNVNFVLGSIFESLGEWNWLEEVRRVAVPVLVIHGGSDSLPVAGSKLWATYMSDARLMLIPEAGHMPFAEQPDTFYPAVDTFLKGEWPEESKSKN